ncbi:DoxX family protein [Micromonospora echinofusca]|uniref:DoxX family membrane protein n=1 Tax=Micromonospora echinofusca TaxID=47858 RepID=A0ABS3VQX0_MICEH|nr:DoxX family membrane protein [Micromonospora echinofusca]MBO4206915.1 DoxX family membrane protein [Micromonospora echinofusca]
MAPLIALIAGLLMARLAGLAGVDPLDGWQPALRVGLATMFALTATAHFTAGRRADLIAMVPPRLPRPGLLVTVTGVLELVGAVGLLLPATARWAAAGLALLMLAMFPANVSAARRGLTLAGRPVTPLGPRTALQLLFLAASAGVLLLPAGSS